MKLKMKGSFYWIGLNWIKLKNTTFVFYIYKEIKWIDKEWLKGRNCLKACVFNDLVYCLKACVFDNLAY